MSKEGSDDLREIISERPLDSEAADYFLNHSPICECEAAETVAGGHGPILADELLSMYLGSPRHSREKYKDQKEAEKHKFPYKSNLFDAIFVGGLSIMREHKATDDEIKIQAKKIATGLQSDDPNNGFYSILQFGSEVIFTSTENDGDNRCFCIYETPIDLNVVGNEIFSHADIFPAGPIGSTARSLRTIRRIQIRQAVASKYREMVVSEYRDNLLAPWQAKNA